MGTLYRIPTFRCGTLLYPEFPIIASRMDLPCHEVDDCNHKFNVTIPEKESHVRNLAVEDRNGKLHVLCVNREEK